MFAEKSLRAGILGLVSRKFSTPDVGSNWIFVFISIDNLRMLVGVLLFVFVFYLNCGGYEIMADFGVNPPDTSWHKFRQFAAAATGGLEAFLTSCPPNISVSCETACMKGRGAANGMSYDSVCRPFRKVLLGHRAAQATAAFDLKPLSVSSYPRVFTFWAGNYA